jgi:PRTRC genetic system protein E
MFKELAPLLAKRSLILTVSSVGDERIRVTITPRPTGKDDVKELSQPFAVEGTAEELDTELPAAIVSYTAEHMTLENSLAQVRVGMEATLKEVKDEAAKKVAEAKKTAKTSGSGYKPPVKVEPVKAPEPPSLFDTPATVAAVTAEASTPEPEPAAADTEDEDESEEDEAEDDEVAEDVAPAVSVVAAVVATPAKTTAKAATLKVAAASAAQTMFDTRANDEAEIMREAFPDTETQAVAA